jgi:hypothetical protein
MQIPYLYQALDIQINALAARINAPGKYLPTYQTSLDGAHPHIEIDAAGLMHLICIERGQEVDHRTTTNVDELLYWIFSGVTFSMACNYELNNRVPNKDFRRLLFSHQESLLGLMSASWQEREHAQHAEILLLEPFDDSLF